MSAQEHIITTLKELSRPIQRIEVTPELLEETILNRVMSKKFRKLKASPDVVDFIKDSIHIAVSQNKPVAIGCVHGGTKLWRFAEYPEIDWAELFNMMYYIKWMRSIAEVYEYGVELEYFSMDVVQERLNNLPQSETDQYTATFESTIEWISQYLPKGLHISHRRYGDAYKDLSEYDDELEVAMQATRKQLNGQLPVLTDKQKYATDMNVRPTEEQLQDPLWREKVEVMHMSVENTKAMIDYLEDRRFIPACPKPVAGVLVTGSTKKSIAIFWAAVGALLIDGDDYQEIVLTPKQLETAQFTWEDVNLNDLKGKNFSKIRIVS